MLKTLESPLDCKEIKPVNHKGNQSWIFIGRTDAEAEAEALVLWPPDVKNWLIWKDPDAGKDWKQEEKGTSEDEMVGWHHQLNGHEFEQAPGVVMDREAWHAAIHGVTKSWIQFSNRTTTWSLGKAQFLKDCLYKGLHELALKIFPPGLFFTSSHQFYSHMDLKFFLT